MAQIVNFSPTPGIASPQRAQRVYTREIWGDVWTEEPNLWCEELALSVAPSMPMASLVWLYGDILESGVGATFLKFLRRDLLRIFVKVEYDTDTVPITFAGVIEQENDQQGGGNLTGVATVMGDQRFIAYGMEWLLSQYQVLDAVVYNQNGTNDITETPPIFNAGGIGNKAAATIPPVLAFSNDPARSEFWSSEDIVQYLLTTQTPKNVVGVNEVKFALGTGGLPTWDTPELRQEGSTTYDLINQLANPRRGYAGWYQAGGPQGDIITFNVDTFTPVDIDVPLPDAGDIPANTKPVHLVYDVDPQTQCTIKKSTVELYDQVVVRSERRRSVGSFSVHQDGTLEKGWTDQEELDYESGSPAVVGVREKRRQDEAVRGDVKLSDVYSYFRIPQTWTRRVGDGEGGKTFDPMFPVNNPAGVPPILPTPAMVYYPDMRVEQTMPLYDGVDYTGFNIRDGTFVLPASGVLVESRPRVWFKIPDKDGWQLVTTPAKAADLELLNTPLEFNKWSASLRVRRDGVGFYLDVTKSPKHVIDALRFNYNATDQQLGGWSYQDQQAGMIATLSIPDDRYCEGKWPDPIPITNVSQILKRKFIYAEGFRKDYVAPETVLEVSPLGDLNRSSGGYIPKEADDDDEHKLIAAAKIAAIYYMTIHNIIALSSHRLKSANEIRLGSMVEFVGDTTLGNVQTVNTPITEIHISSPMGIPERSVSARMNITTWAGEMDPLLIAPFEPADFLDQRRSTGRTQPTRESLNPNNRGQFPPPRFF